MLSLSNRHSIAFLLSFVPILASALSDQCIDETNILLNNSAITDNAPSGGCVLRFSESATTDSCTFDFGPINAAYENACVENGGQFYSESQYYDCNVEREIGNLKTADLYYLNSPFCFGKNCSISEFQDYLENYHYNDLEQIFVEEEGLDCQISRYVDNDLSGDSGVAAVLIFGFLVCCVVGGIVACVYCCCRNGCGCGKGQRQLVLVLPGTLPPTSLPSILQPAATFPISTATVMPTATTGLTMFQNSNLSTVNVEEKPTAAGISTERATVVPAQTAGLTSPSNVPTLEKQSPPRVKIDF